MDKVKNDGLSPVMHCYWWKEWILMAAITGPCICKQLPETSPITMTRKKQNKTQHVCSFVFLCASIS